MVSAGNRSAVWGCGAPRIFSIAPAQIHWLDRVSIPVEEIAPFLTADPGQICILSGSCRNLAAESPFGSPRKD